MQAMSFAKPHALRGSILHFLRDPGAAGDAADAGSYQWLDDGVLVIVAGRVHALGAFGELALPDGCDLTHYPECLIIPGMIDCHIHSGQMDVIASYGAQLLEWLETYTFPAEAKFADLNHAQAMAAWFCDTLLAHGTTTAAVFPTVHAHSLDSLFEAALARGMCLLAGKVLMDVNAPDHLLDTVTSAERDCALQIERWHGPRLAQDNRLRYLLTPRFAATSSNAQLALAGELCRHYGLAAQSHVAENRAEVAWVAQLYPAARSYLDVYAQHGLLRPGSVLAHGIWLDDTDRSVLAAQQTAIAFCPTSNLFIGSGLFNFDQAVASGINVGLATDVGGGTSYSLLQTMAEAYKVGQLQGQSLHPLRAFYLATLGGAKALAQDAEIGNFEPGKVADVCVLHWAADAVQERRQSMAKNRLERLFCLMSLGGQRNVAAAYVAGVKRYQSDSNTG